MEYLEVLQVQPNKVTQWIVSKVASQGNSPEISNEMINRRDWRATICGCPWISWHGRSLDAALDCPRKAWRIPPIGPGSRVSFAWVKPLNAPPPSRAELLKLRKVTIETIFSLTIISPKFAGKPVSLSTTSRIPSGGFLINSLTSPSLYPSFPRESRLRYQRVTQLSIELSSRLSSDPFRHHEKSAVLDKFKHALDATSNLLM